MLDLVYKEILLRLISTCLSIVVFSQSYTSAVPPLNTAHNAYFMADRTIMPVSSNVPSPKGSRISDQKYPIENVTPYCQYERVLRFDRMIDPVTLTTLGYRSNEMTKLEGDQECNFLGEVQDAKGIVVLLTGLGLPRLSMIHYANMLASRGFAPMLMDSPCLQLLSGEYIADFGGVICLSNALDSLDEGIPILLIGYSYGGSIAISTSALSTRVHAVAAIAPVVSWQSLQKWTGQGRTPSDKDEFANGGRLPVLRRGKNIDDLLNNLESEPNELAPDALANKVSIPVFIIGGTKDNVARPGELRSLSESILNSSLTILDAGHPQLLASKDYDLPSLVIQSIETVIP